MTTFKIVFTFDVFFSAETTMQCKVTCTVEIKIKWIKRKQMIYENTYRDDII